jgi:hypothetical protein
MRPIPDHTIIERFPKASIAALLSVLLLYVPFYGLYYFGMQTVFGYFAHDAFYYLTVAKNSSFGFFTFDGEKTTNGFHPLWQYILTALFGILGSHGSEAQLYATYVLGVLLTTLGFVFVGWSVYTVTRSVYLPLWLIPGPFYLFFNVKLGNDVAHGVTYAYSPWSFMNGMESPCTIAAGGLFLYLMTRAFYPATHLPQDARSTGDMGAPSGKGLLTLGISLSLVVMSRLDDVFLLLTTALFFLFLDRRTSRPLRNVFILVLPTLVLLTGYMTFNYISCHSLLPISGMVKSSSAAALSGNIKMSLCDLFPPLHELIRPTYSLRDWGNTAVRSSAMILPMILSLWLATYIVRRRTHDPDFYHDFKWLLPVLFYMVLKGSYNLVNVRLGSQGYWYYALPVLMFNYVGILLLRSLIPRETFQRFPVLKWGCIGLYVFFYLFTSAKMICNGSFADDRYYPLWRDRQEITTALKRIDPAAKLVDRSDGAFAYSLDLPAVCALGYAIDYDGYVALKNDKFLDYCVRRGFNVTFEGRDAYPIRKDHYTLKKIYEHKASGSVFFKIEAEPPSKESN